MAAAKEREKAVKKRLTLFLAEALRFGCLKGFKYFSCYMRGREEMICKVLNEPLTPRSMSPTNTKEISNSGSFNSSDMPFDQNSLMLSHNTQKTLSGYGYMDVGLPPASPSEREIAPVDDTSTLFLLAGYARYSCPYVWVRSNHDRLVKLTKDNERFSKDSPLRLKSTTAWNDKDIHVWDIVAELVKINTLPAPRNPFAVDTNYLYMLDLEERFLATGSMVNLLQKVLDHGADKRYSGLVTEDLRELSKRHFQDLLLVTQKLKAAQTAVQASPTHGPQVPHPQEQQPYRPRAQQATQSTKPLQTYAHNQPGYRPQSKPLQQPIPAQQPYYAQQARYEHLSQPSQPTENYQQPNVPNIYNQPQSSNQRTSSNKLTQRVAYKY
ncbi:uncharacterized protein LOC117120247 [Anneissia japonica]|uniref:uncharacterized protein LOC117120247 n=1 Tax=Anneissia japonica TaxID=1529436 RepID=UPI0014254F71|nr:uncharacterized protein LOC117120247 [Anneissia japonica]